MKTFSALLAALFSLTSRVFSQVKFTAHTITTNKRGKSIMKFYTILLLTVFGFTTNSFSQIVFIPHVVIQGPGSIRNPGYVLTFDVDNDGDIDIASSSFGDSKISWHENDGQQNFIQHVITTEPYGFSQIWSVDMEGDGDIDLLSSGGIHFTVKWYENDGNGGFTTHYISSEGSADSGIYAISVWTADVGNDGDIDIVAGGVNSPEIRWYENPGSNSNFTTHIVDTLGLFDFSSDLGPRNATIFSDLDQDNDQDLIVVGEVPEISGWDGILAWYENDGEQNFERQIISTSVKHPRNVRTCDLDQDGDIDIVISQYEKKMEWFENDGQENFTQHTIEAAKSSNTLHIADLDNDGDLDLVAGYPYDNEIAWLENDGSQNFTNHIIQENIIFSEGVWADDVDLDGDIDVLSASQWDHKVMWYESNLNDMTGVENLEAVPVLFSLHQNYPNPFNPSTIINYSLPSASQVELRIYNTLGQEIRTLVNSTQPIGSHQAIWDGRDNSGNFVTSGVYFYRIQAGDFLETRRLLLLR